MPEGHRRRARYQGHAADGRGSQDRSVTARPGLRLIPEYQLIHEFSNQRLASQRAWHDMLAEAGLTVLRTEPAGLCEAFCFVAAPGSARSA